MRRFLSRSSSAPLPFNWETPTPTCPADVPPRYSGHAQPIAADCTMGRKRAASKYMRNPPISRSRLESAHTDSPHSLPSRGCEHADHDTKVSRCVSPIDEERPYQRATSRPLPYFSVVDDMSNDVHGGSDSATRIVIHDPALLAVCGESLRLPSQPSDATEPLELEVDLLLACLPHLQQHLETLKTTTPYSENNPAFKAVYALTTYLHREHAATLTKIADLTARGEITFDTLFFLFAPGTIIVAKCADTGAWRAYEFRSATKVRQPWRSVYELVCESVDVADEGAHCACCSVRRSASPTSGCSSRARTAPERVPSHSTRLRRVQTRMLVPSFKGVVKICSLDVYPLKYHPDAAGLEASLVDRGRRWLALQGIHHVWYEGPATCKLTFGGTSTMLTYDVESFILLDRGSFMRLSPPSDASDSDVSGAETLQTTTCSSENLLLAPPILYGFSVLDQEWLMFNVEHVQDIHEVGAIPSPTGDVSHGSAKTGHETSPSKSVAIEGASAPVGPPLAAADAASTAHCEDASAVATDTDAVAVVQRICKDEVSAFAVGFEERVMNVLAELHTRYSAESAMQKQTMRWMVIATSVLVFPTMILLLYRLLAPPTRTSRWSGPMHFTIPILSPFSSVVEHESSSFGFRQVVVFLVTAALLFVFWVRFCVRRK